MDTPETATETVTETETAKALAEIHKTLSAIKDGVEVIALALSAGSGVRLLGGGISEGDVHKLAVDRLKRIAAETETRPGRR